MVVVGNEDAHGDSGNDTVTAIYRAGEGVPVLEGGSGLDTFQVAATELTTGGTADAPLEMARLADFDPAEDVLVLSSNLPGPITPTYSDGTLLLELGDGSFASVELGIDSFDVSTIVFADVEAGVEAAFANSANGLSEAFAIDVAAGQGLGQAPDHSVDANDIVEINLPEDTEGQLIAVHIRTDVNYGNNTGLDREDWSIELFLVPEDLELPEQFDSYPELWDVIQPDHLDIARLHLGEFEGLNPTYLDPDYDSDQTPTIIADRDITNVVIVGQIG